MSEVGHADPVGAQLRRLADAGFIPNRGQRSREGQAEYRKALAGLPLDLLRLAIDRIIRDRADHFYPLAGEIRAAVRDELAAAERLRVEANCRRIRREMQARGYAIQWAGD